MYFNLFTPFIVADPGRGSWLPTGQADSLVFLNIEAEDGHVVIMPSEGRTQGIVMQTMRETIS